MIKKRELRLPFFMAITRFAIVQILVWKEQIARRESGSKRMWLGYMLSFALHWSSEHIKWADLQAGVVTLWFQV